MFPHSIKIKDVKVELGKLVKSYRKRDKLSQQELSDKLNISRLTIQHLEAGKNFTIDTLLKTLEHFDELASVHQLIQDKRIENESLKSLY